MNSTKAPIRLSHTQFTKYQQCGKAYQFYYLDKIRPTQPKSSLLFGTAIDKAIGAMLEPKEDDNRSPEEIFDAFWSKQYVGKTIVDLPFLHTIWYGKKDFDEELITERDFLMLTEHFSMTKEDALLLMDKRLQNGFNSMTEEQNSICNFLFWSSMRAKGNIMLSSFRKEVLHKITKVYSAQDVMTLTNAEGDEVIGYVDLVADIEGIDGPVIIDIKTSAMPYEEDAHLTAPQLVLYLHALREKYNTNKVGFIVLGKNILKNRTKVCDKCGHIGTGGRHKTCNDETSGTRCNGAWIEHINPSSNIQLMAGEVPKQTEELVLENIDDITHAIKSGHFTRNLNTCFNSFGGSCEYVPLCYKGKMEGLEKQ